MADVDALIVGAGHNGLVAGNLLAERGWSVLVVEASGEPGGAVRSGELVEPGFVSDLFSAFYPLAVASPVLRALGLENHGLRWRRSPLAVAHPQADGRCAVLSTDVGQTAASVERFAAGDGDAWRELHRSWERAGEPFLGTLLHPFPPVRDGARLAAALGPGGLARFARLALTPVRRLAEERFAGEGAGWLLAGNALHADFAPEASGSGLFGWVLCGLAQQHGYPVPEGGAGALTAALTRRLAAHGGRLACDTPVERVLVERGRAVGARTAGGEEISAGRAVLASTAAPALFRDLVGHARLPAGFVADLGRFQWDSATVKVDWTLDGPISWTADDACRAGTVHIADDLDALTGGNAQIARGLLPERPFLVMGQYSMVDPTRQPAGKETAWAYAHVPQRVRGDAGGDALTGGWDEREGALFADRMEAQIEARAPGFGELVRARHVFTPPKMEATNPNLVGGSMNAGTAQVHQQLVFRPVPGLARAETPIDRLYLCGASAHPGGGVHGAAGANAVAAALARESGLSPRRAGGALARRALRRG